MSTNTRKQSRASYATTSTDVSSSSTTNAGSTSKQQPLDFAQRKDEALETYMKWTEKADSHTTDSAQWDHAIRKQSDAAEQFAMLASQESRMLAKNGQKELANDRDFSSREWNTLANYHKSSAEAQAQSHQKWL